MAKSTAEIITDLASVSLPFKCDRQLLFLVSAFFEDLYGSEVAGVLRRPVLPTYVYESAGDFMLPWTSLPTKDLVQRLRKVRLDTLSDSIRQSPLTPPPIISRRSQSRTASALVSHIRTRVTYLQVVGYTVLCDIFLAYFPYSSAFLQVSELISRILHFEYGSAVVEALNEEPNTLTRIDRRRLARRQHKETQLSVVAAEAVDRQSQWPVIVPQHTVLSCHSSYYKGTQWQCPPVCAVCAQHVDDCPSIVITDSETIDIHLDSLRLTDAFIIQKCILQSMSCRFTFGSPLIDGVMLEKSGVVAVTEDTVTLNVCVTCHAALRKPETVPL
jgi:hypothetical protein